MDSLATAVDAVALREQQSLGELRPGAAGTVAALIPDPGLRPELMRRLMELGFVRGEHVRVLAETWPGGDPFVVRIGETALAMRRDEARAIRIEPDPADDPR